MVWYGACFIEYLLEVCFQWNNYSNVFLETGGFECPKIESSI